MVKPCRKREKITIRITIVLYVNTVVKSLATLVNSSYIWSRYTQVVIRFIKF